MTKDELSEYFEFWTNFEQELMDIGVPEDLIEELIMSELKQHYGLDDPEVAQVVEYVLDTTNYE